MKKELKEKWLKALRGGRYTQGKHHLKRATPPWITGPAYCCLGVLCDLIHKDEWAKRSTGIFRPHYNFAYKGAVTDALIPTKLLVELAIPAPFQGLLARKNDNGETFEMIATYIEENL